MKKTNLLFVALVSLTFQSCSKDGGSAAVDSNGSCTSATINAYNKLAYRTVSSYTSRSELQSIKSDCASYKGLIGGNSCKAEKVSTGEVTTITSSSVDGICNSASQMLSWLDSQGNTGTSSGNNSNSGNGSGSNSQTNYGVCTENVINTYNKVSISLIGINTLSSIADLTAADESCEKFRSAIGTATCKAQKLATGSSLWISYSDISSQCATVKNYRNNAVALAEIEKKKVAEYKGTISFVLLKSNLQTTNNDIVVYQNGNSFVSGEQNLIDEARPYCLASAKFSPFVLGNLTVSFKNVFIPNKEDLVVFASSKEKPIEENSINCLNAKGKSAKDLTVADLRLIFKDIATVLLGK